MDIKLIEKLMAAMERAGMKKMVIKEEGMEIELERETPIYMGAVALPPLPERGAVLETKPSPVIEQKEGHFIKSPMIGTFFASSSPGAAPFVKVGDSVGANSVVCIIEAMKVMNEIKANLSGTILEVLVKNGEPVEFGTKLFRVA